MSETVLAAMIAATATILTTLLQLKISLGRDGGPTPRSPNSSRKKPKLPAMLIGVMLTAATVGGFALSQWFTERERVQQRELRQELQARITEISRTAGELKQTRLDTFAEVETEVLRRMGGSGIVALATVGPCHGEPEPVTGNTSANAASAPGSPSSGSTSGGSSPSSLSSTNSTSTAAGSASTVAATTTPNTAPTTVTPSEADSGSKDSTPPSAATCAETDATPILLCAPIPSNAVVSHVDLFTRPADEDQPWNESQVAAGQETKQARFSEKKLESLADDGMKHVCHKFANWSTQHARVARMIVRYAIPAEALEPQSQVRHKAIVGSTGALAIR